MKARQHVSGYTETMRALNDMEKDTKKVVRAALRKGAEPVAESARSKLGIFSGISLTTIKPSITLRGVSVVQNAKKTTGLRSDFGGLQMTRGLLPAASENEDKVREAVETAIDIKGIAEGF